MEGITMNKIIMLAGLALILAAAPAMAQMMNPGQHMTQQQQAAMQQQQAAMQQQQQGTQQQQYYNPYQMNPGMMGGYGYGMGPQMMGGSGYGMGPQMMGGYGYGMHPNMMGGYGYGMHPNMMGGYGYYGMHPNMMEGRGHHGMHQMMSGWGMPPCTGLQGPYKNNEEYAKFLDDTREDRRKLHSLMFDYGEAMRSPEPNKEKLQEMEKEMFELRDKLSTDKTK
jgi:hypothetical protein